MLVVVVPMIGTFSPVEAYLARQSFSLASMPVTVESSFSSSTVVFGVILSTYALLALRQWPSVLGECARNWPLLAFTAYTLATSAWAASPEISANRGGRMAIVVLVAIYMTQHYAAEDLARLLTTSFLVSACASVLMVAVAPDLGTSALAGQSGAWRGAMMHRNGLGGMAAIGLIVSMGSPHIRSSLLGLTTAALLLVLLIMSRSATATVETFGAGCSALYLGQFVRAEKETERLFLAAVGLLLIGICGWALYFGDDLTALIGRDASFTGRTVVWNAAQIAIDQKPLWGYGHGFWISASPALREVMNYLGWAPPEAHNTWLDICLQLGGVGLGLAVGLWSLAALYSARAVFIYRRYDAVIWIALLIAMFLRSFSETELVDPNVTGMFWFSLAYAGLSRSLSSHRSQ
jgi:exopolysaccharide production protein ExoQ